MTNRPHRWLAIAVIAGLLTCPLSALDDSDDVGFNLVDAVISWIEDAVDELIGPALVPAGLGLETEPAEFGPMIQPTGLEDQPPTSEFGPELIPIG